MGLNLISKSKESVGKQPADVINVLLIICIVFMCKVVDSISSALQSSVITEQAEQLYQQLQIQASENPKLHDSLKTIDVNRFITWWGRVIVVLEIVLPAVGALLAAWGLYRRKRWAYFLTVFGFIFSFFSGLSVVAADNMPMLSAISQLIAGVFSAGGFYILTTPALVKYYRH